MWAKRENISKAIGPFLRKLLHETRTHCLIKEVTRVANKVQRAQSIVGRMTMKRVYLPKVSFWTAKAVDELMKLPNSRHDDFVDALSWIGMGLGRITGPGRAVPEDPDIPKIGTLGYLKWSSSQVERQAQLQRTGGF